MVIPRKIIIDTDIGDDIDDALAIGLALRSPELELLGITTVYQDVTARARIARELLNTANREDIPVYVGCGQPLCAPWDETLVPNQYDPSMARYPLPDTHAVTYLIDMARQYGNQLTIIPIGALTNLALAVRLAPEVMRSVQAVILMGGAYYSGISEWNIQCDPEAADIVFRSGIPLYGVGLDVTMKCRPDDAQLQRILSGAGDRLSCMLSELVKRWRDRADYPMIFHDPLAVAAAFMDVITFCPADVTVERSAGPSRAMTINRACKTWDQTAPQCPNIQVGADVDAQRFVELFMKRVFP